MTRSNKFLSRRPRDHSIFIVEIILRFTPLSNIYYLKIDFDAAQMEGTNKTTLLEARVKKDIYERLPPGTTVQVRYAIQDPCVVLLDGE